MGLITQLLQVTHAQTSGTLANLHKTELLEEIANQLSMGANNLMEDDKYLLECNRLDLATTNDKEQEYWLLAIRRSEWQVSSASSKRSSNASLVPSRSMGKYLWLHNSTITS